MTNLVITDSSNGTIRRYSDAGGQLRKTHMAGVEEGEELPVTFDVATVQAFRTHPPGEFYVLGPAPIPGGDDPGGAPVAVAA